MFYDKYVELCNSRGEKPTVVAQLIGLNRSSATAWKNGSTPTDATIVKLCEHFGVPYDYFQEKEKSPTSEDVELDELGQELVELLIKLTPDEERQVYSFVQGLLAARKV